MRLLATALLVLVVACIGPFAVQTASAGSLVTETFTYPDGPLTANATWGVYSGTPPIDIQVVSGRAVGNCANVPDDHTLFTAQTTLTNTNAADVAIGISGFGLRQSSSPSTFPPNPTFGSGSMNWLYSVDNLGVGLSMVDACDVITPNGHTTWGRVKTIYR